MPGVLRARALRVGAGRTPAGMPGPTGAKKSAPATINKRMTTLRRAFNLGRRATPPKVVTVPEFPRLPEHNAREGFFEKAELFAVLAQITDTGLRDFLEWAFWTGMRKGEIAKLEWSAFDRET